MGIAREPFTSNLINEKSIALLGGRCSSIVMSVGVFMFKKKKQEEMNEKHYLGDTIQTYLCSSLALMKSNAKMDGTRNNETMPK